MLLRYILGSILFVSLGVNLKALAHPVIYKDGVDFESESKSGDKKNVSEFLLSYTLDPKYALGVDYRKYFDIQSTEYYFARLNTRLFRQNNIDSQSNVYLSVGAGYARQNQVLSSAQLVELVADWEDRDYYFSGYQQYLGSHPLWRSRLRAGFSPFRADFEEVNIWFVAQFDRENNKNWETTPLMRTFYKNILWEIGASLNGQFQLNLMFHL